MGVASAERYGSLQDFWDPVHAGDVDQVRKAVGIAKQNHRTFDQEFRVVWPDGTVRWLRSEGRFFYGPGGEPERMLGISTEDRKSTRLNSSHANLVCRLLLEKKKKKKNLIRLTAMA